MSDTIDTFAPPFETTSPPLKKYTVMYRESWMQGSHQISLFQMKRIETANLGLWLSDFEEGSAEYIFEGWPVLQGEVEESIKAG